MFTTLIDKINSILTANDLIQEVFSYEVEQFEGDPAAVVVPSGNESDYNTSSENERIYAFNIKLFVTRSKVRDNKNADRVLRDLVSSVIDDFDKDYFFEGLSMPTGYTMINVFAVPSAWGYAGREDEFRVAEIDLRCRVFVDITAVS